MIERGGLALPTEPVTIDVTLNIEEYEDLLANFQRMLRAGDIAMPGADPEIEELIRTTQAECRSYIWHSVSCVCQDCLSQDCLYSSDCHGSSARTSRQLFEREEAHVNA